MIWFDFEQQEAFPNDYDSVWRSRMGQASLIGDDPRLLEGLHSKTDATFFSTINSNLHRKQVHLQRRRATIKHSTSLSLLNCYLG